MHMVRALVYMHACICVYWHEWVFEIQFVRNPSNHQNRNESPSYTQGPPIQYMFCKHSAGSSYSSVWNALRWLPFYRPSLQVLIAIRKWSLRYLCPAIHSHTISKNLLVAVRTICCECRSRTGQNDKNGIRCFDIRTTALFAAQISLCKPEHCQVIWLKLTETGWNGAVQLGLIYFFSNNDSSASTLILFSGRPWGSDTLAHTHHTELATDAAATIASGQRGIKRGERRSQWWWANGNSNWEANSQWRPITVPVWRSHHKSMWIEFFITHIVCILVHVDVNERHALNRGFFPLLNLHFEINCTQYVIEFRYPTNWSAHSTSTACV